MDPNSGRLYTPDEMDALSAEARAELVELRGAVTQEKAERISRAVAELAQKEKAAARAAAEEIERDGAGDCWIIEFAYRSDDGPYRIGPFASRAEGQRWLECGREFDFEASVVPVAEP